jgi:PPK2 family polyphosphate:nucleotide phosphotransferase
MQLDQQLFSGGCTQVFRDGGLIHAGHSSIALLPLCFSGELYDTKIVMKIGKKLFKLADEFRVDQGKSFRLKDFDPADTRGLHLKEQADELLQQSVLRMQEMQDRLYAQDQWALLLVFQAMDAAGKDGVIKHVMSGVNPQGCQVSSFKQPTVAELDHDFLWRTTLRLPSRGDIGVFNRSYYEEVLVVRVHPEFLAKQRLPEKLAGKKIWKERYEDIGNFEQHLTRNGTVIRKFFLNVSKEEQRQRFLARLDDPDKNWKFSDADVHERTYWNDYMEAYEDMIRHTASPDAPWYVVPADHKWFMHIMVSAAIIATLEGLDLQYPKVDQARLKKLQSARKLLE